MEQALVLRADSGPNADRPVAERTKPRVSGLGAGCALAVYHYLVGTEKLPMNVEGAGSVDAGKALEAGILSDLHDALCIEAGHALQFVDQVRIDLPWATGSADRWYPEIKTVVDSKTGNKAAFAIKGREGFGNDAYYTQLSVYAEGLGAETVIIAMRGVGTQKGDGSYLVDRLPKSEERVNTARSLALLAMEAARQGIPPAPGFPSGYWLCKGYCSFRHVCPSGGPA